MLSETTLPNVAKVPSPPPLLCREAESSSCQSRKAAVSGERGSLNLAPGPLGSRLWLPVLITLQHHFTHFLGGVKQVYLDGGKNCQQLLLRCYPFHVHRTLHSWKIRETLLYIYNFIYIHLGFPGGAGGKEPTC